MAVIEVGLPRTQAPPPYERFHRSGGGGCSAHRRPVRPGYMHRQCMCYIHKTTTVAVMECCPSTGQLA